MERIDKILSNQTGYSRKQVKDLINKKRVSVNDEVVLKSDKKINIEFDKIKLDGEDIIVKQHVYLILNKPKDYISATEDRINKTVLDLVPKKYSYRNLFPAGRLDKDTTGLMIITDDGLFSHNILSPSKHVKKIYNVTVDIPITDEMIVSFKKGVVLNDGECKSANLERTNTYTAKVTLTEGKYHQIKRMFGIFKAKVVELQRIGIGEFKLPDDLKLGQCRELTEWELNKIQEKI